MYRGRYNVFFSSSYNLHILFVWNLCDFRLLCFAQLWLKVCRDVKCNILSWHFRISFPFQLSRCVVEWNVRNLSKIRPIQAYKIFPLVFPLSKEKLKYILNKSESLKKKKLWKVQKVGKETCQMFQVFGKSLLTHLEF